MIRVRLFLLFSLLFLTHISLQAQNGDNAVYKLVEEAPRFHSRNCETSGSSLDKLHCSKFAFKQYVQSNMRYPREAQARGITGNVLLEVIIEKDGSVSFKRIMRDIGGGCGAEAVRLVKAMPKWIPGKKGGRNVRVQMPLTVQFKQS